MPFAKKTQKSRPFKLPLILALGLSSVKNCGFNLSD